MRDAGDGAGQDQADLGATSFERDHELTVLNNERDKLAQIERALARIDDGTLRHVRVLRGAHRQDAAHGLPACHTVHDMQAARGTSLSDAVAPDPDRSHELPARPAAPLLFALVAAAAYAVDQASKLCGGRPAEGRPDVHVVGDLLVLHLTRNPGAAFSTGTGYTVVLTVLAVAAVLVVVYLSRRLGSVRWALALGLLLAGVAGNLTDRLFRDPGAVARPRHRLPDAAALAGLQRRRHVHQRRRRPDPAPGLPRRAARRRPDRGPRPGRARR